MISVLIPGCSLLTCGPITNKAVIIDITENPKEIHTLGIFLNEKLDEGLAAGIFYSPFPYKTLKYIGAVSNSFPSDLFNTYFTMREEVDNKYTLKLVVKLETMEELYKIAKETHSNSNYEEEFGVEVALNILNSFEQYFVGGEGINIVFPTNWVDLWYKGLVKE